MRNVVYSREKGFLPLDRRKVRVLGPRAREKRGKNGKEFKFPRVGKNYDIVDPDHPTEYGH